MDSLTTVDGVGPTRWLALALVTLALLAGCAADGTTNSSNSTSARPTVIEQTKGTAALEGLIVDDETRPIQGAEILIALRANSTEAATLASDPAGRFLAKGLEGGEYIVYARKIGYADAPPRPVILVEGETQNVTLTLQPLARIVPFHDTKTYSMEFTHSFCVLVLDMHQCSVDVYSGDKHVESFDVDEEKHGDLMTFLAEATWTSEAAACPGYFRTDVFSP